MNSENSKTGPHRLLLNISDKINLKRSDKYFFFKTLAFLLYMEKYKRVIQKQ